MDRGKRVRQVSTELGFQTRTPGLLEVTEPIADWLRSQSIVEGVLTVMCRHSSASLLVQENADPDVRHDLEVFFQRLVSRDPSLYRHTLEGADDMPAHIRAALTNTTLSIPVADGRMALGTWQGIYLFEHRDRPHHRRLALHVLGA